VVGVKGKGPLVTLLAGLVTAAVLLTLSMTATARESARRTAGTAQAVPTTAPPAPATAPPTTAPPTPVPPPPASNAPPAEPPPTRGGALDLTRATFAARLGGGATIAIAVTDGSAVAYLCDGRRLESWLQGTVTGGRLALTGPGGANLTGALGPAGAAGTVTAAGRTWSFEAPPADRPSGLYRIAATLNGAKVVGGWIVLADGSQVGVVTTDGAPAEAPRLDTSTGAVTVNGTQVTALPVDGTHL
jgi:hypothetical protein